MLDDKTEKAANSLQLLCPTCGAKYKLPKYVEGQKYGCKRCSASLMFGKFALLQELGRGGFGVVYKAFQADLERTVALKFLHTDSQESTERFMREARIAANLSHPNITAIYEVGQHEGKPYITMQFVDGITTNRASLTIRDAVFVMRDASIAVDYAHARDIIHRDIKPHNIMVMEDHSGLSIQGTSRRTFVMDFGLARSANKGGTLTTEGQVMGTPAFMSPEQAEGKSCDIRSDVYSLGATLYQLVAKRPPFEAPTPLQILMQVTQEDPPLPSSINPEIDKGLEAIIMKAMAKDPAHRYPSAARLAQDLTSWLAGGVTDAGPTVHLSMTPGALKAAAARKKKNGAMIVLGTALILAGLGGLAWRVLSTPDQPGATSRRDSPRDTDTTTPAVPPPPSTRVLLDVIVDPPGATLRINNLTWKTPVALDDSQITPGIYDLEIMKPGFETLTERVTITAGAKAVELRKKLAPETRKVAFVVESVPPGAKILLNDKGTGLTTPHPIYMDQVRSAPAEVSLELEGFRTESRTFNPTGETQRITLGPLVGSFAVTGAVKGSTVQLFAIPSSIKNVRAVVGLWSENGDQLEQAVKTFDPADAPHAVDRLKTLAGRPDARARERLVKLAASAPAQPQIKPEKPETADARGVARLINAWVLNRYCILATSPRTLDFIVPDLVPRSGVEITVPVDMVVLVTVSAKSVRPSVGRFRVQQADPSPVDDLVPGGDPVRVAAGLVTLHYAPPPNDPLLRTFTIPLNLKDKESYELAGHLLQYSAEAHVKDGDIGKAMRAYTALLNEKGVSASDLPGRAKVVDTVRTLYRAWVEAVERQGKAAGGDLAAKLEEARRKPPADSIPLLLEIYAAKDATPAIRGGAAVALAHAHARLIQPYEAMEWCERFAKEKIDPGQDTITAVVTAIRGYPGLRERWDPVTIAIEEARKLAAAPVKPDPTPPPTPVPANGKVGVLQSVGKFGIFVKLDPEVMGLLSKGDILHVFRDGQPVGEIVVDKKHGPEGTYPHGSAECQRGQGQILKGDEVRNKK